ncbi:5-(carboxyamino)imidazole ribonucleotide synthase [Clostridium vincentii]|uniref:N5-carboxyaminoimidazole ribonucleotide synthase n=1 Tax=Clostridium vincentii TaxID=52704 RepID=A0A2T0BF15_9CLOT|nr:5-(carboxyamino)imidazole ribonucleotide synthase [Clostridium vincentii]PRR82458.1 N5-carboxyaminoimidazole ribonucleotide synthase [Clostridium vincentii]
MKTREIFRLKPPSNIGIVGGGQLGRMLVLEAKRMGYNVIVLDPKPNSPAGQVADEQIISDFSDIVALRELATKTDVITYEFEHIDVELLKSIEKEGYKIYPSSNTLRMIQNKYEQKTILKNLGVRVPIFYPVTNLDELKEIFYKLNGKIVLKTSTGGYDGKGNVIIKDINKLEEAYKELCNNELIAEEFIDYIKEVSIVIAKNHEGISFYPVSENIHKDSILIKSIIPAKISNETEKIIIGIAEEIIEEIDDYGIFCIEFFIDSNLSVLVNEIAPRPHNSGHYTIEGCITSQFEQLIRIVTGMPLGSTKLRLPCAMYNILGNNRVDGGYCVEGIESGLELEDCYVHLYGKSETGNLKKIGHITALDYSTQNADLKAQKALSNIKIEFLSM